MLWVMLFFSFIIYWIGRTITPMESFPIFYSLYERHMSFFFSFQLLLDSEGTAKHTVPGEATAVPCISKIFTNSKTKTKKKKKIRILLRWAHFSKWHQFINRSSKKAGLNTYLLFSSPLRFFTKTSQKLLIILLLNWSRIHPFLSISTAAIRIQAIVISLSRRLSSFLTGLSIVIPQNFQFVFHIVS